MAVLTILAACSTTTSEREMRRAALWEAATECARGKASLKVDRIDNDGRVHVRLFQGGRQEAPAFTSYYTQKAHEKLAMAERAGSPARMVESGAPSGSPPVRPSSRVTTVAVQTVDNKILVPVVLNEGQAATFLLDTGANITVITPNLARRLGVELASGEPKTRARVASGQEVEVSVVRVRSLGVGSARVENLGVVVYDLPALAPGALPSVIVDGLLGTDFVGRFTMTVDPRAGKLTLQLDDPPGR